MSLPTAVDTPLPTAQFAALARVTDAVREALDTGLDMYMILEYVFSFFRDPSNTTNKGGDTYCLGEVHHDEFESIEEAGAQSDGEWGEIEVSLGMDDDSSSSDTSMDMENPGIEALRRLLLGHA